MPEDDPEQVHAGDRLVTLDDRLVDLETRIRRLTWAILILVVLDVIRAITTPDQLAAILASLVDILT